MMPTKGTKQEKVRAAFEYADFFLEESVKYESKLLDLEIDEEEKRRDDTHESDNTSGLSRLFSRSKS